MRARTGAARVLTSGLPPGGSYAPSQTARIGAASSGAQPPSNKGRVLFGLGEAGGSGGRGIVLTEGPLDAIAADLSSQGVAKRAALAACGTTITENHREAIIALGPARVPGIR